MLPPITPNINPKPIRRKPPLPRRRHNQPRNQIRTTPRLPQQLISKQRTLIQKANLLREGGDIVREVATARGPDGEEGDGVEGAEGDEGVEGGHEGGDFDAVDGRVPEGDEDAAGEDGDCEGEEADEGDVGDFEVFVEEGAEGDLQGGVGGVGEEEGFLCAGAVGG